MHLLFKAKRERFPLLGRSECGIVMAGAALSPTLDAVGTTGRLITSSRVSQTAERTEHPGKTAVKQTEIHVLWPAKTLLAGELSSFSKSGLPDRFPHRKINARHKNYLGYEIFRLGSLHYRRVL